MTISEVLLLLNLVFTVVFKLFDLWSDNHKRK